MHRNILEVENLSVSYVHSGKELMALQNVTLNVRQRSIVGIVGESGCGKSTLISSIFRMPMESAIVRAGRILINGTNVLDLPEKKMNVLRGRDIAMIFQDPFTALNPVLSVGRQLVDVQFREHASVSVKRRNAAATLKRVGIEDPESRLGHYPHQFSGGMLQRICIAMALLVRPGLLVADEPTTALDATTEVQILELLRDFHESTHASILLVSHHLGVISELCEKVIVMYSGEVVEQAATRDLFERPLHPYTQLLIQCDPSRISGRQRIVPSIPGIVSKVTSRPTSCLFAPRCPKSWAICQNSVPPTLDTNGRCVKCHLYSSEDVT